MGCFVCLVVASLIGALVGSLVGSLIHWLMEKRAKPLGKPKELHPIRFEFNANDELSDEQIQEMLDDDSLW